MRQIVLSYDEKFEQSTEIGRRLTVIFPPDILSDSLMGNVEIFTEIDSPEWTAIIHNPAPRPNLSRLLDDLEQGLKEDPEQFPKTRPEDA